MKLYRFYKKPDNDSINKEARHISDKYPLYALTNKKEFAMVFKQIRDMTKFVETVTDIHRDEFIDYAGKHRGKVLDNFEFVTRDTNKKLVSEDSTSMKIVCTFAEKQNVDDEVESGLMNVYSPYLFEAGIFKEKYRDALEVISFLSLYKIYYSSRDNFDCDDAEVPNWSYDETEIFVNMYAETLRK